jgi:hypothetical protein
MAKKTGLSLFEPLPGHTKEQRAPDYSVTLSVLATVLDRRSGRSAALPYPPSSTKILSRQPIFATGRFFDVKMVGFS